MRRQFLLPDAIQSINDLIYKTQEQDKLCFGAPLQAKIQCLQQLLNVLNVLADENISANDKKDILNAAHEIKNPLGAKSITCLDMAVMYCDARIVELLFENGALASKDTVHHFAKTLWPKSISPTNLNDTLDVLVKYGVDLNESRNGHTALFNARRTGNTYEDYQQVAQSLAKHHATMFKSEKFLLPFKNAAERAEIALDKIIMPFPR